MRTAPQEVVPQTALRDCSKEVGRGRSISRGRVQFPGFCFVATEICSERLTSITAQFYLESKGKYILEARGLANSKDMKRTPRLNFSSSFYIYIYFFFSSPCAYSMSTGLARKAICFTWGSHSGTRTFLCSIFMGISLLCFLATSIRTPFSYSNCLTNVCQQIWKAHYNPKERQYQRMLKLPHNCTHFTCQQSNAQNSPSQVQLYMNCELPAVQAGF